MSLQRLPNLCLLEAYEQALSQSLSEDFVSLLRNELLARMEKSTSTIHSTSFVMIPKAQPNDF